MVSLYYILVFKCYTCSNYFCSLDLYLCTIWGCKFQVPGQRVLALHLLASVLNRASSCILHYQVGGTWKCSNNRLADWGAIWAFILGPEPELAFSLRRVSKFFPPHLKVSVSSHLLCTHHVSFRDIAIPHRQICFLCYASILYRLVMLWKRILLFPPASGGGV